MSTVRNSQTARSKNLQQASVASKKKPVEKVIFPVRPI